MKDTSGPAFPELVRDWSEISGEYTNYRFSGGLTKREWFAGMAIGALIRRANSATDDIDSISAKAFVFANTMLEEGAKE